MNILAVRSSPFLGTGTYATHASKCNESVAGEFQCGIPQVMPSPTVRILVVDDFEPFRRFVTSTLRTRPEFQIVGYASDGAEAVRQAQELRPHLILLDVGLPTLNGIEAARQIRKCAPESKIIFVTQESSDESMREAFKLGAFGYVVKSKAGVELLPAVDAVLGGKLFLGSRSNP